MQGTLKYKNVMLNRHNPWKNSLGTYVYRSDQIRSVAQDVSKLKPLRTEVISFNGQPKSKVFPSAPPVTVIANFARTNHFTPTREMPAGTFTFQLQFNQPAQDQNTWANIDFGMLSSFKKACTLHGPNSPYCIESLRGRADHWMPYDFFFFSNSKDGFKSSTITAMANVD